MTDLVTNSTTGSPLGSGAATLDGVPAGVSAARFAEALGQAQRGDTAGYRWLFDTYARSVGALARIEADHDPDGLVNAVFSQALLSIDRFVGGPAQFAAHLTFLTRFHAVDQQRLRSRHVMPAGSRRADDPPGVDPELLHDALDALRPDQREVLILRVLFGLTGSEAGDAIEQPLVAVRSLQDGVDSRLRAWLEKQRAGR
jgi:DNA-directed RNA polymerase specialized sigma24 family protein